MHHVLGRLPHRRPVEPRRAAALPGRRLRPGQLGLAVRPRPVQLRGASTPTSALAEPLVRGESRPRRDVVERRARRRRPSSSARRSTPAGRRASACSAAPRGTNEDAFAWAQLADAIGVDAPRRPARRRAAGRGARPAAGDDRRGRQRRATVVLLGPDLKEELPVLYLRLRDAAEQARREIVEFAPSTTGLTPYAWRVGPRTSRAAPTAPCRPRWPTRGRRPAGAAGRSSSSPAAPTSPSRPAAAVAALQTRARRRARAPRCCRRCAAATSSARSSSGSRPRDGGLDAAGILQAAADGKLDLLVLLGADPLDDCPDADLARRALAGARRIIAVDTFLTDSTQLADVVLAGGGVRREGGHHDQPRGPRVTTSARQVTPPARRARLDDRRRAGRAARPRPRRRRSRRSTRSPTRSPRPCRPTPASTAAALRSDATACSPSPRRPAPSEPRRVAAPTATATTTGSWSAASSTTGPSATATSPSLAAARRRRRAHVNPLDLDRHRRRRRRRVQLVGATRLGRAAARRRRGRAARHGAGAVQPAGRRHRARSSTPTAPVTDVRIERL